MKFGGKHLNAISSITCEENDCMIYTTEMMQQQRRTAALNGKIEHSSTKRIHVYKCTLIEYTLSKSTSFAQTIAAHRLIQINERGVQNQN